MIDSTASDLQKKPPAEQTLNPCAGKRGERERKEGGERQSLAAKRDRAHGTPFSSDGDVDGNGDGIRISMKKRGGTNEKMTQNSRDESLAEHTLCS